MPGAEERVLKRRITSVQATKKITRAMELIAASRVVQAQQRAQASRPYARQITGVIQDLAAGGASVSHPLLQAADELKKVLYVVLVSDRGLAGAYNTAVLRAAEREMMATQTEDNAEYELITVGRKAEAYFSFRNYPMRASYEGISDRPTYENAREIAEVVTAAFEGDVDKVVLLYTEFHTIGRQDVVIRDFLPLQPTEAIAAEGESEAMAAFEFEPSPESVLSDLLPRYVEARLYAALLDAAASEHANRQRAMKAATDNADEMITKLSRRMNQARQAAITTEIMEIIGGAEGLKEDDSSAAGADSPEAAA